MRAKEVLCSVPRSRKRRLGTVSLFGSVAVRYIFSLSLNRREDNHNWLWMVFNGTIRSGWIVEKKESDRVTGS